jgi:hypothetical protein
MAGEIQGVIGPLSRDDVRRHRHAQGIQGRDHDLDLRPVGAVVLAMPKLEQPVFRHAPVAAGGGTIQADACRLQVIDAPHVLIQRPLKGAPAGIVAQGLQYGRQPVVADVQRVHQLSGALTQRVEPVFHPGFDVVQPMVGLGQDMSQPQHTHPAQAEAHPGAVGGKVCIQQGLEPHPRQLSQHQGNVIDAFTDDGQGLAHAETLPQCSKPLQI